jgi:L-threonylcarbamoyladenylate synthase
MEVLTSRDIERVAGLLRCGEVVALPTETVYGLAADAFNALAVGKIFEIKGRPAHNPLIVHVGCIRVAEACAFLNPLAEKLIEAFWPGPITLVLPKTRRIPSLVSAGLDTVGLRMPRHELALAVLDALGGPLAAPSANPSNYLSPTEAGHVIQGLSGRLSYVLDGGRCHAGVESTIVDVSVPGRFHLLRPGPLQAEELEAVAGMKLSFGRHSENGEAVVSSPGQLKVHYSPRTPLFLVASPERDSGRVARVYFGAGANGHPDSVEADGYYLSRRHDLREVEGNLYALLQELDQRGYDAIEVVALPQGHQWAAVRDRLSRAAAAFERHA